MIGRYILIFSMFILSLNANISLECMNIEKKYFLKEIKTINCKVTKYVEEDDRNHCIEKKYKKFTKEIDNLFSLILNKIDNEFSFETLKSQGVCSTLSRRVYATSIGEQGEDRESKEKDLQNAKNELKLNYKSRLLSSLNLIDSDVPKKCVHSLKTFLNKKVNLKKKKYVNYARQSYFECLDRHPLQAKEKMVKKIDKVEKKDKSSITDLENNIEQPFKSKYGLTLNQKQKNQSIIQGEIGEPIIQREEEPAIQNEIEEPIIQREEEPATQNKKTMEEGYPLKEEDVPSDDMVEVYNDYKISPSIIQLQNDMAIKKKE